MRYFHLCLFFFLCFAPVSLGAPLIVFAATDAAQDDIHNGDELEYMRMKPLFFPVVGYHGATQQIAMVISLEVQEGDSEDLENYRPRLRNAYIQELYGSLGTGEAMIHGNIVDIEKVRTRLLKITQDMVGEELAVHDVLFEVVEQRPLHP